MNFNGYPYFEKPSAPVAPSKEDESCCIYDSAFNLSSISNSLCQTLEPRELNKGMKFESCEGTGSLKPNQTHRSSAPLVYDCQRNEPNNLARIEPFIRQSPISYRLPYTNSFCKSGQIDSNEDIGACGLVDEIGRPACFDSPTLRCEALEKPDCRSIAAHEEHPDWKRCGYGIPPSPNTVRDLGSRIIDDVLKDFAAIREKFGKLARVYDWSLKDLGRQYCQEERPVKFDEQRNSKSPETRDAGKSYKIRAPGPEALRQKKTSNLVSEPAPSKRLHVSNIPFDFQRQDLMNIFEYHGAVSADVIRNDRGPKGFGFVTFKSVEKATEAKRMYDGMELNDRVLEAESKFERIMKYRVPTYNRRA